MMKLHFLLVCFFLANSRASASVVLHGDSSSSNVGQRIREMLLADAISTNNDNNSSLIMTSSTANKQKDLSDTLMLPNDENNTTSTPDVFIPVLTMSNIDVNPEKPNNHKIPSKNVRSIKENHSPLWKPLQFHSDDDEDAVDEVSTVENESVVLLLPSFLDEANDTTSDVSMENKPVYAASVEGILSNLTNDVDANKEEITTVEMTDLVLKPSPPPAEEIEGLSAKGMICNVLNKESATSIRCYALNLENIKFEKSECSTTTEGHVFCEKNIFK